jgi:hypothetical protein
MGTNGSEWRKKSATEWKTVEDFASQFHPFVGQLCHFGQFNAKIAGDLLAGLFRIGHFPMILMPNEKEKTHDNEYTKMN